MRSEEKGAVVEGRDAGHRFSKPVTASVRLIEGYGIEGDAHAGRFMKHRYLAKRQPKLANNRQVHLIQCELFRELAELGHPVRPGDLGENITTSGLDLLALPLGCLLRIGTTAAIELTGLRTPCGYIDQFRKGLKHTMIVRTNAGPILERVSWEWSGQRRGDPRRCHCRRLAYEAMGASACPLTLYRPPAIRRARFQNRPA